MRNPPEDEFDRAELEKLRAEPWMIDLLGLNPDYCSWGPLEDYMLKEGSGWDSRVIKESWVDFGPWELNDLNEVANFYFSLSRACHNCEACDGSNLNPATKKIADTFYDFDRTGRRWCDQITQDEVAKLLEEGRLFQFGENKAGVTAEQVNKMERERHVHDAINRWILIKARAQRLGVYGHCDQCEEGSIYDEPAAHVSLVLWVLHPRKGCSRGVKIERITQSDLPAIGKYLAEAKERNASRFAKVNRLFAE